MKRLQRILLPLVIVAAGIGMAAGFVATKPKARRGGKPQPAPLVDTLLVEKTQAVARVRASGVVEADQQVVVMPQVSGRIVKQSDKLRPGGRFKAGEVLARIDPRDYRLALRDGKSRVRQAELELELEQGRQAIAQHEWQVLGNESLEDAPPLVLRKPYLETTKEKLAAAKAALTRAQLNLERTWLRAPFNAMVVTENVDIGQVVGPNSQVATLIGTDRFRVVVSIPVERLAFVEIPGVNAEHGSRVIVTQNLGQTTEATVEGHVIGLGGQLDPQTRTGQLLVAIDAPLEQADGGVPILPGAFVDVEIQGRTLDNVVAIPRAAIVEGKRVWLVDADERLESRAVTIAWRGEENVFITEGLEAGDRVVTTALSMPLEGMPVRVQSGNEPGNG